MSNFVRAAMQIRWIGFAVAVLACLVGGRVGAVTLESAQMGSTGIPGGVAIDPAGQSVVGWRFEVGQPFQVSQIGAHLFSLDSQDIFGAIVSLDSLTSVPLGSPFDPGELVASVNFTPPSPSDEILVPLNATLAPGEYALLFGTDFLGATGKSAVPNPTSPVIPQNSFF